MDKAQVNLSARKRVHAALAALRKAGFIARAGLRGESPRINALIAAEGNEGKPYVYYHHSMGSAFEGDELTGRLYLRFGVVGDAAMCGAVEAGLKVREALENEGLRVDWPENPYMSVGVLPWLTEAATGVLTGAQAAKVYDPFRMEQSNLVEPQASGEGYVVYTTRKLVPRVKAQAARVLAGSDTVAA